MTTISKIASQLAIDLLYGISSAKQHQMAVIIYGSVNLLLIIFFLIMITFFTCRSCVKHKKEGKLVLNDTYMPFNTVDSQVGSKEAMSRYSMDTEHEFSYYDNISNNYHRPVSEVATMKLLRSP